jgi:hypothetical protein
VAIVINRIQKQAYSFIMSVAMLVLIVFAISYNAYNSRFLYNEKIYNYILLADNKEWSELLSQLQTEGHNNNDDFIVKYSLLAESALGTLPEHLFQYPINNAEEFLFIHDRNPIGYLFNAMFYENAKVYDEAFHQYFEYSTLQNNGNCFTSLRHMIEYCIKEALRNLNCDMDYIAEVFLHSYKLRSEKKELTNFQKQYLVDFFNDYEETENIKKLIRKLR